MSLLLIEEEYSSELSRDIQKAYNTLIHELEKVPKGMRSKKTIEGTGGKVSVCDLVAYQIGWGTLLLKWYEAGKKGKIPQMPGEGFDKWDYIGLAQKFYVKYQSKDLNDQLKKFRQIVIHILKFTEHESQTGQLDSVGVWEWCTLPSGKEWPLSKWVKVNTVSPYKKAAAMIRKLTKK